MSEGLLFISKAPRRGRGNERRTRRWTARTGPRMVTEVVILRISGKRRDQLFAITEQLAKPQNMKLHPFLTPYSKDRVQIYFLNEI